MPSDKSISDMINEIISEAKKVTTLFEQVYDEIFTLCRTRTIECNSKLADHEISRQLVESFNKLYNNYLPKIKKSQDVNIYQILDNLDRIQTVLNKKWKQIDKDVEFIRREYLR